MKNTKEFKTIAMDVIHHAKMQTKILFLAWIVTFIALISTNIVWAYVYTNNDSQIISESESE